MLTMEIEHGTDIDAGQDIAVNHQQWIGSANHVRQTARGAQRLGFLEVLQSHSEPGAVLEVVNDTLAEMMRRNVNGANSRLAKLRKRVFQKRTPVHWQHGLGNSLR